MGGVDFHSDLAFHPAIVAAGNAGTGLWCFCVMWASRHGRTTFVPYSAALELGDAGLMQAVTDAGLWEAVDGGFELNYGPSSDWPLPLWRFALDD